MAAPRAYPELTEAQQKKFWQKVDRTTADKCWLWIAKAKKGRGYGALTVNKQPLSAHRVAWELMHGPLEPGKYVYHAVCNNPACCNPAHLAVGSKSDAMYAASRHGTKLGRANGLKQGPKKDAPRRIAKPYPKLTERQLVNFWRKVDKESSPYGCWLWTAAGGGSGYGSFRVAGKNRSASRISYILAYGEPDLHLDVCHNCPGPDGDNPMCVNPDHLYAGTRRMNLNDCVEKGRKNAAKGVYAGKTKLKPEQVYEIRRRGDAGESRKLMAEEFGVTAVSISNIVTRKTWTWLPEMDAGVGL